MDEALNNEREEKAVKERKKKERVAEDATRKNERPNCLPAEEEAQILWGLPL